MADGASTPVPAIVAVVGDGELLRTIGEGGEDGQGKLHF